jgi:hypothetical protein
LPIYVEDWCEDDDEVRLWLCDDGQRPEDEAIFEAGVRAWTFLQIMAVNYLYLGCEATQWRQMRCPVQRSPAQLEAYEEFARNASLFCLSNAPVVVGGWERLTELGGYGRQVVCRAFPLTVRGVLPALPNVKKESLIKLETLLSKDSREALLNPELLRRSPEEVPDPLPKARVLVASDGEWNAIVKALHARGIVEAEVESQTVRHKGEPV